MSGSFDKDKSLRVDDADDGESQIGMKLPFYGRGGRGCTTDRPSKLEYTTIKTEESTRARSKRVASKTRRQPRKRESRSLSPNT